MALAGCISLELILCLLYPRPYQRTYVILVLIPCTYHSRLSVDNSICVLTTTFYPLISIHSNIRIISLILAARKNSKIAIMRSCHLVSALSANLRLLHLYQSTPVRWTFLYAITDIKNCMCNYWYRIYTAMDFPCFISILSNLYNIQSYCCLITASYYINCAIDSESDISWINYSYIIEEVCTSYRRPRHT